MYLLSLTGPTGAGKTTFINRLCGQKLQVGTSLMSCTDKVQTAQCEVDGQRITLIDTPGFDDTFKSQADILRDIADFLEHTYQSKRKLAGVIYMHRISDTRVGGIARENFRLFTRICGGHAMQNVMIVTTMWEGVSELVGKDRETELAGKAIFFKDAIDDGARMKRHYDNKQSAQEIIRQFLDRDAQVLLMQKEIVDEHKMLPQTSAGLELHNELDRQLQKHQEKLQQLNQGLTAAVTEADKYEGDELQDVQDEITKLRTKLQKINTEKMKLTSTKKRGGKRAAMRKAFGVAHKSGMNAIHTGWCLDVHLMEPST